MITAIVIGAFGIAGALLRFAVDSWFAHLVGPRPHWPWATLAVNVTGSFIIGASLGVTGQLGLGPEWQAGLSTGLAGMGLPPSAPGPPRRCAWSVRRGTAPPHSTSASI
ncbi:fluoride efflux transporter FluC [Pseudarthrobacter sp. So.54]